MLTLEKNGHVTLTDSGGRQKEASSFRVPVVTLRERAEWAETLRAEGNVQAGSDLQRLLTMPFVPI